MGQNFSSEPVVEKETERDHNETFNVAVSSCQGWRMSQEDNHSLILDLPGEHKAAFFAVYDGHGSARVSKHASEALWRHLSENEFYLKGKFKEALESAFLTFDREVNESYNAQLAGTTAICVLIVDNIVYCANIGDSRAVASVNCECIPLSHDHKPENPLELKRILAAGGYVLGNRVNGNLALSRAFGDFHYKGNEQLPPEQQIVSPCPDINMIELNDNLDFLVLACDGIWDVLSSEDVVEFVISRLERNVEPGLICEQLTTRCLAPDYELVIGCDNMTVLLVCYMRGRSWNDYCTDIFNSNSKRLGELGRTRPNLLNDTSISETTAPSTITNISRPQATDGYATSRIMQNDERTAFPLDDAGTFTDPSSSSSSTSWIDEQVAQQLYESTLKDNTIESSNEGATNQEPEESNSTQADDKQAESGVTEPKSADQESDEQPSASAPKAEVEDLEEDGDPPAEGQIEQVVVEVQLGVPDDGDASEQQADEETDGQQSEEKVESESSDDLEPAKEEESSQTEDGDGDDGGGGDDDGGGGDSE